jgi:hypothetical protein
MRARSHAATRTSEPLNRRPLPSQAFGFDIAAFHPEAGRAQKPPHGHSSVNEPACRIDGYAYGIRIYGHNPVMLGHFP